VRHRHNKYTHHLAITISSSMKMSIIIMSCQWLGKSNWVILSSHSIECLQTTFRAFIYFEILSITFSFSLNEKFYHFGTEWPKQPEHEAYHSLHFPHVRVNSEWSFTSKPQNIFIKLLSKMASYTNKKFWKEHDVHFPLNAFIYTDRLAGIRLIIIQFNGNTPLPQQNYYDISCYICFMNWW